MRKYKLNLKALNFAKKRNFTKKWYYFDKFWISDKRSKFKAHIYVKPLELLKWLSIDKYRHKRYGKPIEFSNFYMLVGRRGSGKSQTLTKMLFDLRKKHGNSVYIATNYYFKYQDFPLDHWQQILQDYDKPIIFAIDEIQQEFDSRQWADFPVELFYEISQSRKKSKMLLSTAQFYKMVDNRIRDYSDYVIHCSPVVGIKRWIRHVTYDRIDYERNLSNEKNARLMKIPQLANKSYIAGDYYREMYDSFRVIERMRDREYIPARATDMSNYKISNSPDRGV